MYRIGTTLTRPLESRCFAKQVRNLSTRRSFQQKRSNVLPIGAVFTTLLGGAAFVHLSSPTRLDSSAACLETDSRPNQSNDKESLTSLFRSYVVYSACSLPSLVDAAPSIISAAESIPGVKQLAQALIRFTFFDQVRSYESLWLSFLLSTTHRPCLTSRIISSSLVVIVPPKHFRSSNGSKKMAPEHFLLTAWK